MDGVAVALQAPEEAEGEDAHGEADEGHHDPDSGDDGQEQLVHSVVNLEERKDKRRITICEKKDGNMFFFQLCEETFYVSNRVT